MCFEDAISILRKKIEDSDYVINDNSYKAILEFFTYCAKDNYKILIDKDEDEKTKISYGKKEFLLNVNKDGKEFDTKFFVPKIKLIAQSNCEIKKWFKVVDETKVLPARWLCHFIGLRHRCAHIFIEDPCFSNCTLIQIRSFKKEDSPGCFDIAVGGHAKDDEEISVTAMNELKEELGLDRCDFDPLFDNKIEIGGYAYGNDERENFYNYEYRYVFAIRLKSPGIERISFTDKEVAGIVVMRVPELFELFKRHYEEQEKKVASGLLKSLTYYIEKKYNSMVKDAKELKDFDHFLKPLREDSKK